MVGKTFMGRMDCKSHRGRGCFEIKSLHLEPVFNTLTTFDPVLADFVKAIPEYAAFDGCDDVEVAQTSPGFARQMLRRQLQMPS